MTPATHHLHPLRSVAHEPDEEPNRLQGGGSHRREYDCCHASLDNSHTHIDDVPGHHRHFAARHIIRLMLRYTPRCWICWGWMSSCHPVCTASSAREGACLDVFAYSATICLWPCGHRCFLLLADQCLCPQWASNVSAGRGCTTSD